MGENVPHVAGGSNVSGYSLGGVSARTRRAQLRAASTAIDCMDRQRFSPPDRGGAGRRAAAALLAPMISTMIMRYIYSIDVHVI